MLGSCISMHACEAGPASLPVNWDVPNLRIPAAPAQDSSFPSTSVQSSGSTPQEHQIQAPDQVFDPQTNEKQTQAIQVSDNKVIATTPDTLYTPIHETWPGPVIP